MVSQNPSISDVKVLQGGNCQSQQDFMGHKKIVSPTKKISSTTAAEVINHE